jgi:hypothetical protein
LVSHAEQENIRTKDYRGRKYQKEGEKCIMKSFLSHILVGKPEGERPLCRPRNRWTDNIKMDLKDTL